MDGCILHILSLTMSLCVMCMCVCEREKIIDRELEIKNEEWIRRMKDRALKMKKRQRIEGRDWRV